MARIRTIKPSFWEDEKIAKLPRACRLFYIGTWNQADDMGVIRGNPALLKSAIFPYDEDLRVSEVQKWIDALVDARMLIPITYKSESYYIVRTFRSHQKFDARYPNFLIPKEISSKEIDNYERPSGTHRVPIEYPPREVEGEREGYREYNTPYIPLSGESGFEIEFEKFRELYPGTKRGHKTEFENFKKKHKDWRLVVPLLVEAIKNEINFHEAKTTKGEFVPEYKNLSTWINSRCWEQEFGKEVKNEMGSESTTVYRRGRKPAQSN